MKRVSVYLWKRVAEKAYCCKSIAQKKNPTCDDNVMIKAKSPFTFE